MQCGAEDLHYSVTSLRRVVCITIATWSCSWKLVLVHSYIHFYGEPTIVIIAIDVGGREGEKKKFKKPAKD